MPSVSYTHLNGLGNAHHITAHDDGQLLMGAFIVDIKLDVREIHHMEHDRASVARNQIGQVHHLLLDVYKRQTFLLCDRIGNLPFHRAVKCLLHGNGRIHIAILPVCLLYTSRCV